VGKSPKEWDEMMRQLVEISLIKSFKAIHRKASFKIN
jgi:hypothetical protein